MLLSFLERRIEMEAAAPQNLCIFEDEAWTRLLPLAYTRPVYDLVCGLTSLREKILRHYPGCQLGLHCRAHLAEALRREEPGIPVNEIPEGDWLFINGRVLADARLAARIPLEGDQTLYFQGDTLIAARLIGEGTKRIDMSTPLGPETFASGERVEVDVEVIRYPWDLIERNGEQIEQDFEAIIGDGSLLGMLYEHVSVVERDRVYVGEGARMKPGTVLDGERGPVYVDKGVTIFPNVTIEGPAAIIGPGTEIKAGARICGGTTIGPVCKVGGEVDQSIILGYSNKQHDGYLGHSYIGSWANLGAGSTNSDLKNNYHPVRVWVNGDLIDTGSLFVGLIMGDHSKSGINTMFNTGTVVGVCCNVFGAGFPPKFVPSFSWGGSEGLREYDLERAVQTARTVMARRNKELTSEGEEVLRHVFQMTVEERKKAYQS
ncbi:MAG: GlmU family protein [bacterium]